MRAMLIDPTTRVVSEVDVPDFVEGIRRRFEGARLLRVGTLPGGDGVHVVATEGTKGAAFTIGGSGPHRGYGLIVGKRGRFGMIRNSTADLDGVASIVSFAPAVRR
jgi:hypothetical protein